MSKEFIMPLINLFVRRGFQIKQTNEII